MKRSPILFLQVIIVLIGIGALVLMLWEPHLEGRNVHATLFQIYFKDVFLAYAYIGSISFFVVLYKLFKLLEYIGRDEAFSMNSLRALRIIKYCAIILICFIVGAEAYFFIVMRGQDDITGGVVMGLFMIAVSTIVAVAAALFERTLQKVVDIKSENDLTV